MPLEKSGSSNWKCYICKASFSQYGLLTLHRQREHNETTPKQKNIEVEWNMVSTTFVFSILLFTLTKLKTSICMI